MDESLLKPFEEYDIELVTPSITSELSTTVISTTGNPFTNPVYVEWYWVVLGLIIPILLGSVFCILDHLRRKKGRNTRQSEQRLESMCERNKYVPPKYEEIIPNNRIVIESVPELDVAPAPVPNPEEHTTPVPFQTSSNSATQQAIFTVETEISEQVHSHYDKSDVGSTTLELSSHNSSILSLDSFSVSSVTNLNMDYASTSNSDANISLDSSSDQDLDTLSDIVVAEAPPSYEEYHKYELYGSRAELV